MAAQIIGFESGPLCSVLEVGDPLPAEDLPTQTGSWCVGCIPTTVPNVVTEFLPVPPHCLPLPEGAIIPCPAVRAFCETGEPQLLGGGRVSVPATFTFEAHAIFILAPNGEAVCIVHVPEHRFLPATIEVTCPNTEGVTCTCSLSPILCETCGFSDGREAIVALNRPAQRALPTPVPAKRCGDDGVGRGRSGGRRSR